MSQQSQIVVLGGGPAGVAAAWQLHKAGKGNAVVLEQRDDVGGNSGSFMLEGLPVDYGSHRLHPSCRPDILSDLQRLLGPDLLSRPRHGRIRLRGRWIHFPIRPLDLMSLPPSFGAGVAADSLRKLLRRPDSGSASFASVLEQGLGRTICRDFYFPYAVKIWGLPPEELSDTQARRRVSGGSLQKMAAKVLRLLPGVRAPNAGRFFYPRNGYGQITQALASAARQAGARIELRTTIRRIRLDAPVHVEADHAGTPVQLDADHVWSTIPLPLLARLVEPAPPAHVLDACERIAYRAMILVYLVLEQPSFTPFDAHYFPEADIALTRLSEPKHYNNRSEPANRTVLCGELPCSVNDRWWNASDAALGEVVVESLARCGLAVIRPPIRIETRRLSHAYPIYRKGYEEPFHLLDEWVAGLDRVLTFGRQGLFAHDNTHHTLAMAYDAVACLNAAGEFDRQRWQRSRAEFDTHVVED